MLAAARNAAFGLTAVVVLTAAVASMGMQAAPPAPPKGVPATRPPPRERVARPEDVYKPSKVDARTPDYIEPGPQPGAAPAAAPDIAAPTPAAAPDPAAPLAPNAGASSTPALPTAPAIPAAVAAPVTATSIGANDFLILGVLALVVILPLGIGLWWIMAARGHAGDAAQH